MGTKTSTSKKAVHSMGYGNAVVFHDQVAVTNADIDASDVIQPVKVPAGTVVHKVRVKTTELDTHSSAATMTAKIGFTPCDGSAAPSGADVAVAADAAWGQNAEVKEFDVIPPYVVEVDSWLNIVIGTGAATEAATGTVYAVVEGDARGVK